MRDAVGNMKASKTVTVTVTHGDSIGFQLKIVQWEPRTWVQNFLLRRSNVGVIKEKIANLWAKTAWIIDVLT